MTKKKAAKKKAGPKLVEARAAKKRTGTLPGLSKGDEELNGLARVYVDERDVRLQAGLAEKRAKDAVLSAMTRKKMTSYRYDSGDEIFEVEVVPKDATQTLKVKVTSKADDDGFGNEGDSGE